MVLECIVMKLIFHQKRIFFFIKTDIRGMLGTLYLLHYLKLLQPFSKHARNQQVLAYNHSFITIIQGHGCKEILFSLLHAKKIADAVLLYVFNIGFPASLLEKKKTFWLGN